MATNENVGSDNNNDNNNRRVTSGRRGREKGSKHTRYTDEQIEALEKVYAECSNPNRFQRSQMLREHPSLNSIDNKQLKIWFQNRRCREKQKKEFDEIQAENQKLTAANKLLRDENNCLHKKIAQLICENEHLRNQVLNLTTTTTTRDPEAASTDQLCMNIADNSRGLLFLANETRNEFLSKATGTAITWIPFPRLKLGSWSSVSAIYVSYSCIGIAARACTIVPFDPHKTMEILKNRVSWSRDCRNLDVLANYPTNNGGNIELVYTQYYAPCTLACARDFWTLRYTSCLDDGSFVVCEKSVAGSDVVPSSPVALEYVRGRMLASGYLIRPCEGGSTLHIVSHLDLEASSVPEMIRPLYQSSELVAENMIVNALHYIEHLASEMNDDQTYAYGEDPAFLRSFSQRLARGFNDAVNGFNEDGWLMINASGPDDVIVSVKPNNNAGVDTNNDSVICVKASVLLQNVFPAMLVRVLKENRASWMDFNFAALSETLSKAPTLAFPGANTHNLSENAVLLGHTNYHEDEVLEVIRFGRLDFHQNNVSSEDLYHLQLVNGMDDTINRFGACSEVIFAPIERTIPNDSVLLSSGFRIFSLNSNRFDGQATWSSAHGTFNEASSSNHAFAAASQPRSILILAFQFPFNNHVQEDVTTMAIQYIQHVVSSVKNIYFGIMSSGSNPATNATDPNATMGLSITSDSTYNIDNLAVWICQSYRSNLGVEMLGFDYQNTDSLSDFVQHHPYAIICFSFMFLPVCLYANQAAVNMLETTLDNLQTLMADQILDSANNVSLDSVLPTVTQQGYATLPPGCCLSMMNHRVAYEQGVVWRVQGPDGSIHSLVIAFINWFFD